jgi:hypothetical protein
MLIALPANAQTVTPAIPVEEPYSIAVIFNQERWYLFTSLRVL